MLALPSPSLSLPPGFIDMFLALCCRSGAAQSDIRSRSCSLDPEASEEDPCPKKGAGYASVDQAGLSLLASDLGPA